MTVTRLIRTDKLKDELAEALPLSELCERLLGVELTVSGVQHKGLCPLHEEDTPSFYVNDARGVFHCFGCKAGGDGIDLVRRTKNLSFHEALGVMAEAAGVDMSQYERPLTEEERERERLRSDCEYWLRSLVPYGVERVPDRVVLEEFGVGAATGSGPDGVPDYCTRGVIFPYRAPNGRLVGWKARDGDKTFGTPREFPLNETTIFGIQAAREHAKGHIVVVEGEYDCLNCHAIGLRNVVATGGSAFTEEQWALLESLHIQRVTFAYDGDQAGRLASHATAERFWNRTGVQVRIAELPDGADPDDLIASGLEHLLRQTLEGARHALEWLLWEAWNERPRASLSDKLDFISWVRETYGDRIRPTEMQLVLRTVADWLEVSEIYVQDFVRQSATQLYSLDSEKVVLGRAMHDQGYFVQVRKLVGRNDFWMLKHQRLWQVLEGMLIDSLAFDQPTVRGRAEAHGIEPEYLDILLETGDQNIQYHEEQVADLSLRRQARDDALVFRDAIGDPSVPSNQAIGALTHAITQKALRGHGTGFRGISEQVDEAMDILHERMKNPTAVHGLELGSQFPTLSQSLQGFQPRRFILVAASSGVGKSTLSLQFCSHLALRLSVAVDFISLEMDEAEILFKLASHLTGINGMAISGGALNDTEAQMVERAMALIRKSPLRIYAPDGMTPNEFLLYAREQVMARRTEVFVIDYAQLMTPEAGMEKQSGYEQLGHFGRTAKMKVARAMDTTVLCCAQLRRDAATKDRPTKEDMGDSYQLVRDADVILVLKENENSDVMDLWLDKNRQGVGNRLIPVIFDRETQTLREAHGGAKVPDYRVAAS